MKQWIERLQKKDGWITLVVIFAISAILPIFLFFFVELNYFYGEKDKAQNIADNLASSAVRNVVEEQYKKGIIEISENEAKETATKLFMKSYGLGEEYSLPDSSWLKEVPELSVYVLNEENPTGRKFVTNEGIEFNIKHPTVIIHTSVKPKGIFFGKSVELQSIAMYEVTDSSKQNSSAKSPESQYTIPAISVAHIPNQGSFTGWRWIRSSGTPSRTLYIGYLNNGKFDGIGRVYDANGKMAYQGAWKNGIYNGYGLVYNPDGTEYYAGTTLNGIPNGYGVYSGEDGITDYDGNFVNGYREGSGTTYGENGKSETRNYADYSNPQKKSVYDSIMIEKKFIDLEGRGL